MLIKSWAARLQWPPQEDIMSRLVITLGFVVAIFACQNAPEPEPEAVVSPMKELLAKYTTVRLTTDLDALTESERAMLPHLIRAAQAMEGAYWGASLWRSRCAHGVARRRRQAVRRDQLRSVGSSRRQRAFRTRHG